MGARHCKLLLSEPLTGDYQELPRLTVIWVGDTMPRYFFQGVPP
jgi:hypothetical protein